MDSPPIDELARRFVAGLPAALGAMRQEVEANFRAVLQGRLGALDLTSRSEFDVQSKVLERARERISALEERLARLEAQLAQMQSGPGPARD